jgi:hypothetical protein
MTEIKEIEYVYKQKQIYFDTAVAHAEKQRLENPFTTYFEHKINDKIRVECYLGFNTNGWVGDIFYNDVSIHEL